MFGLSWSSLQPKDLPLQNATTLKHVARHEWCAQLFNLNSFFNFLVLLHKMMLIQSNCVNTCFGLSRAATYKPVESNAIHVPASNGIQAFPYELWYLVASYLSPIDLLCLGQTSQAFYSLCSSNNVWRIQCGRNGPAHSHTSMLAHMNTYANQDLFTLYRQAFKVYHSNRSQWSRLPSTFGSVQAHRHGVSCIHAQETTKGILRIYTGGWDGQVNMWLKQACGEFELVSSFKGLECPIESIKIKGGYLVAGCRKPPNRMDRRSTSTLMSWPLHSTCVQPHINLPPLLNSPPNQGSYNYMDNIPLLDSTSAVSCLDHDGANLIIAGYKSHIIVYDLHDIRPLAQVTCVDMRICGIHWLSTVSNHIITTCETGTITVWTIHISPDGPIHLESVSSTSTKSDMVTSHVNVDPNGIVTIMCGYKDGNVCRWESNLSTWTTMNQTVDWLPLNAFEAPHTTCDWVSCIHASFFNDLVFTGSWDCKIRVWDRITGSLLGVIQSNDQSAVLSLGVVGQTLIAGCYNGKLLSWDFNSV
ncbi:hypothetical protein BDEG_27986 [Batrachochytrium dendrobatidis JEL423]|uniref:F-box domain-containing protein n=2 Tax=Batrachochytrium dendrobatidis (strain JEL423) TaxID=403673 RepID=A0A177WY39_BATDL|nr:hypothetical protein BDEG_27986 [Batrachochytrium dendrobatidis JEL423]